MGKAKVVRFYKPSRNGWKRHKELVIHKLEVFKAMTEGWVAQYGENSFELVAI